MDTMTTERPKASEGREVYGSSTAVPPAHYDDPQMRAGIEAAVQADLARRTGLAHEWGEWRHIPESTYVDDEGQECKLRELWTYTCEATGPEGLS